MGYNIIIGEQGCWDSETRLPGVAIIELASAPAFGELTDNTNERWPGYSDWADFLEATGLQWLSPRTSRRFEAFVRRDCPALMVEHPGVRPLLPIHRTVIDDAYAAYVERIGKDKLPGWGEAGDYFDKAQGRSVYRGALPNAEQYDGHLARLTWLRFWVHWALDNCRHPVLKNT